MLISELVSLVREIGSKFEAAGKLKQAKLAESLSEELASLPDGQVSDFSEILREKFAKKIPSAKKVSAKTVKNSSEVGQTDGLVQSFKTLSAQSHQGLLDSADFALFKTKLSGISAQAIKNVCRAAGYAPPVKKQDGVTLLLNALQNFQKSSYRR